MNVQPIYNYNLNFGDLRGIQCDGDFSPEIEEHANILKIFRGLPAFKEFGEVYDYIAHFRYNSYQKLGSLAVYELKLAPVNMANENNTTKTQALLERIKQSRPKNKKIKFIKTDTVVKNKQRPKISNLPIDFCVCIEAFRYEDFIKSLTSVSFHELEFNLKYALKNHRDELKRKRKIKTMVK